MPPGSAITLLQGFSLILLIILCLLAVAFWVVARGRNRGATREEQAMTLPGDDYFAPGSANRVHLTRAASIAAPPADVWPWLAQLGRGAGFYSYDFLDNGRKTSARHLVTWIPSPQPGDASAIGYLRHLEEGRRIVWWAPGERFLGTICNMAICMQVTPDANGARLVIRISADTAGLGAKFVLWIFLLIDCIMAPKQVAGIKRRVEQYGARREDPAHPETGARDQYQYYEVQFAGGRTAGAPGREGAARWRRRAIEDGVLVLP